MNHLNLNIMLPFICDIPIVSNIELNKPKTEYVICTTALLREEKDNILNITNIINDEIDMYVFPTYIGTTISSISTFKTSIMKEELNGFYSDNYELVVKLPMMPVITRKMKIKTISKYSPKIIL